MLINEALRNRADQFAHKFNGETDEDGEAKTFMDALFAVFNLDRYALARFEYPTKRYSSGKRGRADLFWRGKLLIEAKSGHLDKDTDWENTLTQALDYVKGMSKASNRPEYVLLLNFKRLKLYRLTDSKTQKRVVPNLLCDIPLLAFAQHLDHFAFFLTAKQDLEENEIKANQEAAQLIATVHDSLELQHYGTQNAAILLSQILFCLFAEDTGIFEALQFTHYIKQYEQQPEQLGNALLQLFEQLNTPEKQRDKNKPIAAQFPYINGSLFRNSGNQIPPTTAGVYQSLYNACLYDWSAISPEIFGSLFQAVMNPNERRTLGAHYTSETNILRLLNPLFLTELKAELKAAQRDRKKLERFRLKISQLQFLDPACGCGNFLVVTYRELRLLDIQVVAQLQGAQMVTDTSLLSNIPLHHFWGYEIDPTAAHIATIAMWLTEHQMNVKFLDTFGVAQPSIPLNDAAQIINTNSLHIDWQPNMNFIVGNPPFVGKHLQNDAQKKDVERLFKGVNGAGNMDYVACWHLTAAQYLNQHPQTRVAFVSTNSIVQGEQTGILWGELFGKYHIKIQFAHQTFKWSNEAKGIAAVHCVIIGFGKDDLKEKTIFEYPDIAKDPIATAAKNISPYLVEGNDVLIVGRTTPICSNIAKMTWGNKPVDGGNLILADDEKDAFIKIEPNSQKYILPLISAREFLHGQKRWCIWLVDTPLTELRQMPHLLKRINAVKEMRLASSDEGARKLALFPTMFRDKQNPDNYIVIPNHSSENRDYIPFGFFTKNHIPHNSCSIIADGGLYLFGQISSKMHMTWVRYVCGRIKSDYRYSNTVVYNNYPFPQVILAHRREAVAAAAQAVLDARAPYIAQGSTLADLYDPLTMPPDLVRAHQVLDKAVDKCYRDAPFTSEPQRIAFLFDLYEQYTAGLFVSDKKKKGRK
jgi:hypothetical protein